MTLGCNPPNNNRFCPDDYVTRGQMAAFLKRAIEGQASAAGPSSLMVARTEGSDAGAFIGSRSVAVSAEGAPMSFWCALVT